VTLISTIFYFLIFFSKFNTIIDYNNLLSHCVGSKDIQGIWEKEGGASWFLSCRFSFSTPVASWLIHHFVCILYPSLHFISKASHLFRCFSLAAFLIPVIPTNSLFYSIFLFGTKICSSEVILFLFLDLGLSLFSSNRLCPIRLAVP